MVSNRLIFPSVIPVFCLCFCVHSFVIFTGFCYCPRPSWIWEQTDEPWSQSSHCVGMAASGLTFDQVEPYVLVNVTRESRL